MTPDLMDLGRHLQTLPCFVWMERMGGILGDERVTVVDMMPACGPASQGVQLLVYGNPGKGLRWVDSDWLVPDLSCSATLGCLLALVREKHGDHVQLAQVPLERERLRWVVVDMDRECAVVATGRGDTHALARAAALVAALGAPC